MENKLKTKITLPLISILLMLAGCHQEQLVSSPPEISEVTVFAPKLPVISPEEWETWYMQDTYEIRWKPSEEVKYVKMELVRKLKPKLTIIPSYPNTGYFEWTIPSNIQPSLHYRIKITDVEKPEIVNYSKEFIIKSKFKSTGRLK